MFLWVVFLFPSPTLLGHLKDGVELLCVVNESIC